MFRRRAVSQAPTVEALEGRRLFAATTVTLDSGYTGSVTGGTNAHFPLTKTSTAQVRTLALSVTQNSNNGLSGTLSIDGLGNLTLNGYIRGNHFRGVLSGDGNGLISGTLSGQVIHGKIFDRVKGVSFSAGFSAASNSSASTGSATLNFKAGSGTAHPAPIAYYTTTSSDGVKFFSNSAATKAGLAERSDLTFTVSSENAEGLISGTVTIGSQTAINFTAISTGRFVDLIFSSSSASGEVMAAASGDQIASGSINLLQNGIELSGTFHSKTLTNGIP